MKTFRKRFGYFNQTQTKISLGKDISFETALKVAVRHQICCLYEEEFEYFSLGPMETSNPFYLCVNPSEELRAVTNTLYFWEGKIISIDEAIAFYVKMFGADSQQAEFFRYFKEQGKEQAVYFLENNPREAETEFDRTYFLFLRRFDKVEYLPFDEIKRIINF